MDFILSMGKLCLMTLIYSSLYSPINQLLQKNNTFNRYHQSRKNYIIKNLMKTFAMFYIFISFIYIIDFFYFNLILTNSLIRNYGAIYVGNDLAGLIMVDKLPKTTKFHHIVSVCLFCIVSYIDVEKNDIVKMICIYTIFSFIPYCVNAFLALRFFVNKNSKINKKQIFINKVVDKIRIVAKNTYMLTCFANWIIHLNYFINKILIYQFNLYHIIYILLLIPIINDDIILLKWLNKKIL